MPAPAPAAPQRRSDLSSHPSVARDMSSPNPPESASRAHRPRAEHRLRALRVAASAMSAGALLGASACGGDSSAATTPSDVAASDVSRIASARTASSAAMPTSTSPSVATSSAPRTTAPSTTSSPSEAASTSSAAKTSIPSVRSTGASHSPAALTIPATAKAHTPDGAKAFVKFYWETLDRLDARPQDHVLVDLFSPTCAGCSQQAHGVAENARSGTYLVGSRTTIENLHEASTSTLEQPVLTFDQQESSASRIERGGKRTSLPPIKLRSAVRLVWDGAHWRIGMYGAEKA